MVTDLERPSDLHTAISEIEPTLAQFHLSDGMKRPHDVAHFGTFTLFTQTGRRLGTCDINDGDLLHFQFDLKVGQVIFFVLPIVADAFDPKWEYVNADILVRAATCYVTRCRGLVRICHEGDRKPLTLLVRSAPIASVESYLASSEYSIARKRLGTLPSQSFSDLLAPQGHLKLGRI